jgi:hypothetical protein
LGLLFISETNFDDVFVQKYISLIVFLYFPETTAFEYIKNNGGDKMGTVQVVELYW